LDLTFADPLDAIVGLTDTLVTGGASYEECIDPNGCTWGSQFVAENTLRDIVSGYAQIPEPASLAMLGVGLFGLGMTRCISRTR
jgi:PEP-CTERM motif